jgi:hypothetical protein
MSPDNKRYLAIFAAYVCLESLLIRVLFRGLAYMLSKVQPLNHELSGFLGG